MKLLTKQKKLIKKNIMIYKLVLIFKFKLGILLLKFRSVSANQKLDKNVSIFYINMQSLRIPCVQQINISNNGLSYKSETTTCLNMFLNIIKIF